MKSSRNSTFVSIDADGPSPLPPGIYRCHLYLLRDASGWSAVGLSLPGVCSQGGTMGEALENFREALAGALGVYLADATPIPWVPIEEGIPAGAVRGTVFVDMRGRE